MLLCYVGYLLIEVAVPWFLFIGLSTWIIFVKMIRLKIRPWDVRKLNVITLGESTLIISKHRPHTFDIAKGSISYWVIFYIYIYSHKVWSKWRLVPMDLPAGFCLPKLARLSLPDPITLTQIHFLSSQEWRTRGAGLTFILPLVVA